jgi:hypothetical protein
MPTAPGFTNFLVESGQGPCDDAVKRRDFCRLIFWPKAAAAQGCANGAGAGGTGAAKALATTPSKGVTFAG